MITTSTYLGSSETSHDLLAAFSAIDHGTSAQLPAASVDRLTLRLLVRLCALASLHGPDGPRRLLEAVTIVDAASVVQAICDVLESGRVGQAGAQRSELQQELVHFSRIVDIGTDGFEMPATAGVKRIRGSHRLPESLKVLSELMVVARGRVLQRGGSLPAIWRRQPGSSRLEPADGILVKHPSGVTDYVLVVSSHRRRLRLQIAYYFDCLLAYLAPMEAFPTLSAYLVEMAPPEEVGIRLVWSEAPDLCHVGEFTYDPSALALSPFDAVRRLTSTVSLFVETEPTPTVVQLEGQRGRLLLHKNANGVLVTHETPDGTRTAIGCIASFHSAASAQSGSLVSAAVGQMMDYLADREVRSIECGHIHLDRKLDQDQEVGAGIGNRVYHLLSGRQAEPPLLTPMMDDDHVLVKLRPTEYVAFLKGALDDTPFRLVPESSPIVRAVAVALYGRALGHRVGGRLVRRGDNLFLRLADGTFCELFENVDGAAVSGCVLFEVALLVYRCDPDAFDMHVNARYPGPHVHGIAGLLLDGDEPHDVKVERLAQLYSRYAALTDLASPDPDFTTLVGEVLERHRRRPSAVHVNILEDYYEVQQGKVRQLIADLQLPIRLVTCHFNTQTGRVAMVG